MTVRRTPLAAGAAAGEAALIYRQLWQEITQQAEPAAAVAVGSGAGARADASPRKSSQHP